MHHSPKYHLQFPALLLICVCLVLSNLGCRNTTPHLEPPRQPPRQLQECTLYINNAEKLAKDGQFKSSNYFYQKAIALYEKNADWPSAITCYIKVGENFQNLDDNQSALGNLNSALNLTQKHLGYQPLELAKSFKRLAFKELRDNQYQQALELYQKALGIQLEVLGENHREVAKTYNSIALVYWNMQSATEAENNYKKSYAIKLRQYAGLPDDLKKKFRLLDKDPASFKKGQFQKARDHFNRSIEAYQKLYGNSNPIFASIYEQIGMLYALEGNFEEALRALRQSLTIRLDTYGDQSAEVAESYLHIGICLRLKGDYTDSLSALNTALTIKEEKTAGFQADTADIYFQLGKVYFQLQQWGQSLLYFQDSLIALVPGFKDRRFSANPSLANVSNPNFLLQVLLAKAKALRMRYMRQPERVEDLQSAHQIYLLLANLVDTIRRGYKSESYKLLFSEKIYDMYAEAIQTALFLFEITHDPLYKESAFIFSEKSKAAVLAESLSEVRARRFAGIPAALLQKEMDLKNELTHYDTLLEKEYQEKENGDKNKIKILEDRYYTLLNDYRLLISDFEKNYKKYYDLKYNPLAVQIKDLQLSLDNDEALLEYFIGESILHIFVLTRHALHVESVPLEDDLNQLVADYYRSIKKIEDKTFLGLNVKLYALIFAPVQRLLAGKSKLIIIPDSSLYYVPIESLAPEPSVTNKADDTSLQNVDYLIKHYDFVYHYSAGLRHYSQEGSRTQESPAFLGFAPVFGVHNRAGYILTSMTQKIKGSTEISSNLRNTMSDTEPLVSQLPASEEELQAIISLFNEHHKRALGYFCQEATEKAFKTLDKTGYNLIHIATHSLEDKGEPKLAGLVFASTPKSQTESQVHDGILYSGEIYNLNLNAELIVLSSCESGVGKLIKGEGMMALNRGFFYAGIRNIVFSLWKVEDRSTSQLMIAFYRNILNGRPFSKALRQAKLELLKNPFTAFPKYWSGFILVGR